MTTDDNRASLGYFVKMLFDLIGWDAERTRQFEVRRFLRLLITSIEEQQ